MLNPAQENIIKSALKKYKPTALSVFGSYARNEQSSSSDLDLLVDFNNTIDLLELIGIEQELSEKLGIKVDLVTKKSISKHLRPFIEKDLIKLI